MGKSLWQAQQIAHAVAADWQQRPAGALDSRQIERELQAAVWDEGGFTFYEKGDVALAEAGAVRLLEALYRAPYLAHATLEPMNCTSQVKDGKVHIRVPSQVPPMGAAIAARVAGVAERESA